MYYTNRWNPDKRTQYRPIEEVNVSGLVKRIWGSRGVEKVAVKSIFNEQKPF